MSAQQRTPAAPGRRRAADPDALAPSTRAVYDVVAASGPNGIHVGQIRAAVEQSPEAVRQTLVRLVRDSGLVDRLAHGVYALSRDLARPAPAAMPLEVVLAEEPAVVPFRVPLVQVLVGDADAYRLYVERVP
ncbi:MAG TPA: hypothetical protein VGB53_11715 [Rubricoccaceae bacterium]|jgi:predicted transcriptional regulator of viral defense system